MSAFARGCFLDKLAGGARRMPKRGRRVAGAFDTFAFSAGDLPRAGGDSRRASTRATTTRTTTPTSSRPGKRKSKTASLSRKENGSEKDVAAPSSPGPEGKAPEQGSKRARSEQSVFVAPPPAKYRERYRNVCAACFAASRLCDHGPLEVPLRLLLIGHNPSEHAWKSGFLYSNPTNRMMRLLTGASIGRGAPAFRGLLPEGTPIEAQNEMPAKYGIGLTDLGLEPGNNAADYSKKRMLDWAEGLYARLAAHHERAGAAPALVAFTGKRQFRMIFPSDVGKISHGEWTEKMPAGWPLPASTRVWVLPSSSGRAVMSHDERIQPYRDLASAFHELETADPLASSLPSDQ